MKSHLKLNGVIQLTNNLGNMNAFESELLQNKYIKAGWRTRDEVLALGLNPKDYPERAVIDRESFDVDFFPEATQEFKDDIAKNHVIGQRVVKGEDGKPDWIQDFYTVPQKDHKEFNIPANYTIVQEDETLTQEYKDEQRKNEYNAKGVTQEAMIVALWEKIVENKNDGINALQAKRAEVKVKFPKA